MQLIDKIYYELLKRINYPMIASKKGKHSFFIFLRLCQFAFPILDHPHWLLIEIIYQQSDWSATALGSSQVNK